MTAQLAGRNDDIEVLRAVAVLFTLICHINTLLNWKGPQRELLQPFSFWGGVDLFFCISGFVITLTLLRHARDSWRPFAVPFYIRRIFRIWPAALLWLFLPLLAARFFNDSGVFGNLRADLPAAVASALQVENAYSALCGRYIHMPCGQADVYWSLSLEEQFYLVFPLLLYALTRRTLKRVLIVVASVQFFLVRPYEGLLWSMRTDSLACGVLLALWQEEGSLQRVQLLVQDHRAIVSFSVLLLLALVGVVAVIPELILNAGLLALLSVVLVGIASADANLILPWRALRPWLLWTGTRSFAIYLVHNPCFRAVREVFARLHLASSTPGTWAMLICAIVLIAVAAEASHRLVEMPLRKLGRRIARQAEVAGYALPHVDSRAAYAAPERLD